MASGSRQHRNRVVAALAAIALAIGLMPLTAVAVSASEPEGSPSGASPAAEAVSPDEGTSVGAQSPSGEASVGAQSPATESEPAAAAPAESPAFQQSATVGGVTVTVEADAGAFPAGAALSVEAVPSSATEEAVAAERGADQNVAASYTFDVKVLGADGAELQPADGKSVRVSFAAAEVADPNLDAHVYHVAVGAGEAEELAVSESGTTATAESDGFSYYTVEFTYNNLEYVLPGGESIPLADILAVVGLEGEPESVEVSNPELFSASDETGEWVVTSHKAFSSDEWMRVTIAGRPYEIAVTDEQGGGTCGTNLTWTLENGTLTISGEGEMDDFNPSAAPWYGSRENITTVVIEKGVKSVGKHAFHECEQLTSVTFPKNIIHIRSFAFANCTSLESVAFQGLTTSLGLSAFYGCESLKEVTLAGSAVTIGADVFTDTSLEDVYYNGREDEWKNEVIHPDWASNTPDSLVVHCNYPGSVEVGVGGKSATASVDIKKDGSSEAVATAEPDENYCFANWTVDGRVVSTDKTYRFASNSDVTLVANFARDFTIDDISPYTYVGKEIVPVPVVKDMETGTNMKKDDYSVSYQKKIGETYTDVTEIKDAGDYKVIVTGLNEYNGAVNEKLLSVEKAKITITADSASKVYDGTDLVNDGYSSEGLAEGDAIESVTVTGSRKVVGKSPNVPSKAKIVNAVGDDVTDDYVIHFEDGTLEIIAAPLTIKANDQEYFYDGDPHGEGDPVYADPAVIATKVTVEGKMAKGDEITSLVMTGMQTDIGVYENEIEITGCGIGENGALTDNYDIAFRNGTLSILQPTATVTITGNASTATYDGKEHSVEGYTVKITSNDGKYTADDFTGPTQEGAVAKGTGAGTYSMGLAGKFTNNNDRYDVTFEVTDGKMEIAKAPLTVTAIDQTYTYNGEYQGEFGTEGSVYTDPDVIASKVTAEGLQGGDELTRVVLDGHAKDVGTYPGTVLIEGIEVRINDATADGNYDVTWVNGTLTITDAPTYMVEFVNYDGTVLQSGSYTTGGQPKYMGDEPTRPATAEYTYTFKGWEPEISAVTGDATYTATFTEVPMLYSVTWLNYDGTEIMRDVHVPYGQVPKYEGPEPTRPATAEYTYTFKGWEPEISAVTGDATYTAAFTEVAKKGVYKVVSGEGSTWTEGSSEPLVFVFKRTVDDETSFDHFAGILMDGKAVPEKDASGRVNYTAEKGSVVVSLQPAYVATLPEGEHALTALFDDGNNVDASFTVAAKDNPAPKPDDKNGKSSSSAKTGDNNGGLIIGLATAAFMAFCVVVAYAVRRRRDS